VGELRDLTEGNGILIITTRGEGGGRGNAFWAKLLTSSVFARQAWTICSSC